MKMFSKAVVMGTTAILSGLIGVSGALAQVETITVTAQKREQTLQDTPVSVAVVTGAQIEQSQIRDAADLQMLVPSLRVSEFATSTNTEFNLRGIGTSSFNPGLEPSVGIFIDGVYRPRSGSAINDLLSVERVEVIRGPQSTLFGRNTPAGVVSIITQKPEYDFGYTGEVTIGNFGARVLRGTVTGPLSDSMAFRLDATTHSNDGYITAEDGRDINNRDRQSYRAQLLWNPGDNTEIRIIGDYGTIDENCCAAPFAYYDPIDQGALVGLGGTAVPANPHGGRIAIDGDLNTVLDTSGVSFQLDHDFDNITFTSITAIRNYDEDQNFDADFSDLDLVSARHIQNQYDSFTQEFRLTSTGDNTVDWMMGGFYYDNNLRFRNSTPYGADARNFFDAASAPSVAALVASMGLPAGTGGISLLEFFLDMNQAAGVGGFVPLASGSAALPTTPAEGFIATSHGLISEDYQYDTEAWSFFGQLDFHVTDDFTVTLGGRYSNEDKSMTTVIDQPDPMSAFSFVDLAQDLRLVAPGFCDPGLYPVIGGDACAYLVPVVLLGQGVTHYPNPLGGAPIPIDPTSPLPGYLAGTGYNPLLGFSAFQNWEPVNASDFPTSRNDTNFSGNIILSYDVSDTLNVYASYATGFKPGGFNVSTNAAFTGVFEFEEETSSSFEVGMKGTLWDNHFVYAVALFDQEIEGFQTNNFVGNGFALENAGSIQVSGLEFEGTWAPTPGLVFTGGFTYLFESKYGDYQYAPCPDAFNGVGVWEAGDPNFALCEIGAERTNTAGVTALYNDLSGRDRGNSEFVGSLTGTYTWNVGDSMEAFVRGEATNISSFGLTTSQDPRTFANQEGFAMFNGSFGLGAEDGSWGLQVWGRNLFEQDYVKGAFPSVGYLGTSVNAYPGDPRTYGITLRIRG